MDILKKNIFLVVLSLIVLISAIIAGVVVAGYNKQIAMYEKDVKLIIEAEKSFVTSRYALTKDSVNQAEHNYLIAEEKFNDVIAELNEKFPRPNISSDMTSLKFKKFLRQTCIRMENLIRGENIRMPDNLQWFSYDKYMAPDVLPNKDEIDMILNQLEIVQEIVYIISQSEIEELGNFRRPDALKMTQRDLYNFMPFILTVTGNLKGIQGFLNSLHDAKYLFIARDVSILTNEPTRNAVPNFSDKKNVALPKHERIVYSQEAKVKAQILIDYLEFPVKE